MTAAPARGTVGRQTDIPATSRTAFSSQDGPATSSHPTQTSTHLTALPTPVTPQRGRLTTRYPDSLGRVPLHRRGTSNTYERLEDLLREAGYKETRVFTPEGDRAARSATETRDGGMGNSVRGSVGAVVDFIAGFVSRGPSLTRGPAPLEANPEQSALNSWSLPPSPLAHTVHIEDDRAKCTSSMASLSRSSSKSVRRHTYVNVSTDPAPRTHAYQVLQHQSAQRPPHNPHSYLSAHHHINHRHHQLNDYSSKSSSSTKPDPPNARAYLRHMVSAPNIQPLVKRPSLSEASLRSHALRRGRRIGTRPTVIPNDEDNIMESDHEPRSRLTTGDHEHRAHPPVPRNWIESVAKALLNGVSGPVAVTSDAASTRTAKTALTRKSSPLSDKSNRQERGRAPTRTAKPPFLCVQVQDVKAKTSEGQVACTRVTCHSTPASRAGSRARNGVRDDHTKNRDGGQRREGDKSKNRRRGKDRDANVVPTLARMKVENDDWMAPRQRYSSGLGMEGSASAFPGEMWSDDSGGDDDDDEEEGELGLDRLLVPARRQHSIHSLRKHLHRPQAQLSSGRGAPSPRSPRSGRTSPFGGTSTSQLDWGNTSWSSSRSREWAADQGEEGEDGYNHVFASSEVGLSRSGTKWRRTLPGLAQWTTSP